MAHYMSFEHSSYENMYLALVLEDSLILFTMNGKSTN